ncbi:helix-turn-helix domain-containing protein [Pedobacter sp. AW1-32]|uniref:helix-turn-helix domain-containing protein n=1 Tax=Pedobacter sp. AW1-32 TaxID=3383026 RepID=UPI003FEDA08F
MTPYIFAGLDDKSRHYARHKIKIGEPNEVIDVVCSVLKLEYHDLIGLTKLRQVVEGRHIAIGLISVANPAMTLKKIGSIFNRDHSTIIYAKRTFNSLYEVDPDFKDKVEQIKAIVNFVG